MLVRVLKTCFADGGLRTAGTQFDWSGKDAAMSKHFSPVVDEAAAAEVGQHVHQTGRRKLTLKRVESDDIV
jgi:hypothetical protein